MACTVKEHCLMHHNNKCRWYGGVRITKGCKYYGMNVDVPKGGKRKKNELIKIKDVTLTVIPAPEPNGVVHLNNSLAFKTEYCAEEQFRPFTLTITLKDKRGCEMLQDLLSEIEDKTTSFTVKELAMNLWTTIEEKVHK